MTPERWQQITQVFDAALARNASSRNVFLDEACAADRDLRAEVDALLEGHRDAGSFGETPVFTASDLASPHSSTGDSEFSSPAGGRRMPWWMVVIAASFVATFVFFLYSTIWGPADPTGIAATFAGNTMELRSVVADSPFAKGGLQARDRVLSIDGLPMRVPRDWTAATGNFRIGLPHVWLVSRQGENVRLEIVFPRARLQQRLIDGYVQVLSLVLSALPLGLLIAWKRPHDPVARIGAWFILTAAFAFGFPPGWAVIWRELPTPVQVFMWIPQISRFVLEGIFLTLFLVFPRRLITRPWIWILLWAPVVATLPWRVIAFYGVIQPGQTAAVPPWILQAGFARTMVYLAAGIIVLAVGYRRLLDLNEKRRVRVLMVGTALSVMSALITAWFDGFQGRLNGPFLFVVYTVFPLNTACPVSLAYAILRHRVFDIQVIIRQGLQYAMARGTVIGVVPAIGALLVLDLALNSQEPLAAILQSRGWIYAALSGLALITYWQRQPWLEALDRRFFRERYNAQRVLRDVVEEIREARSFERVAPRVVARIETALHCELVSVMVRQPDEAQFRPLASFPSGNTTLSLPANSKLAALMRALEKPLEGLLTNSSWLEQRLPREESQWARRARIDLLVPIATAAGHKEALLALGVKRSEEPYTREDQELLEAIASSLGLLLEQTGPAGKPETFEECPECGACYDFASAKCAADGATLTTMHLPRTLVGRYRLERRRGQGGMGTVYEAADSALERRVAIKVIRDDWVGSVEAAQRFRREARAAAGFAHPNVVTVHDYGVEADTRGFLVMELLEGRSLRDELELHERLDSARALWVLRGVCGAVEAAHRRQLIHRDLKPENIFLATSEDHSGEVVKVLDFGIAKFLAPAGNDAATRLTAATGVIVGTPAYMSPEQLLGGSPNVQWDLWALAVVAYEILTGHLPSAAATTAWDQHAFFARCFDTNPAKRPPSAAEFLRQLEAALSGRPNQFRNTV
jgi:tRNA A-37 threonylcarbamoyl transferase component Bud32